MVEVALAIGRIIPWQVFFYGGMFVGLAAALFYRREQTTLLGKVIWFGCAASVLLGAFLMFNG